MWKQRTATTQRCILLAQLLVTSLDGIEKTTMTLLKDQLYWKQYHLLHNYSCPLLQWCERSWATINLIVNMLQFHPTARVHTCPQVFQCYYLSTWWFDTMDKQWSMHLHHNFWCWGKRGDVVGCITTIEKHSRQLGSPDVLNNALTTHQLAAWGFQLADWRYTGDPGVKHCKCVVRSGMEQVGLNQKLSNSLELAGRCSQQALDCCFGLAPPDSSIPSLAILLTKKHHRWDSLHLLCAVAISELRVHFSHEFPCV